MGHHDEDGRELEVAREDGGGARVRLGARREHALHDGLVEAPVPGEAEGEVLGIGLGAMG